MEQFDSSVEKSSIVSEQQQRNDEQQCSCCVAELTNFCVDDRSKRDWLFELMKSAR